MSKAGLHNIGNTCYMNSAIQLLASTPGLIDYFLNDFFKDDINLVNPLGSKGEIANAFADLAKQLYNQEHVYPKNFKRIFQKYHNRFCGNYQHDAAEFLMTLLDSLSEDLNLVKVKPYVNLNQTGTRDDLVVAIEHWDAHIQRNQSIIVDLFQGQYKSKLQCPQCKEVSISFDPYMSVQLPLHSTSSSFCYYILDEQQQKRRVDITTSGYEVAWLKNKIRDDLGTEHIMLDLTSEQGVTNLYLDQPLSELKKQLKQYKLLARPMTDSEICIPYANRIDIVMHHIDAYDTVLTEPITYVFNHFTTIGQLEEIIANKFNNSAFQILIKQRHSGAMQIEPQICFRDLQNPEIVVKWFENMDFTYHDSDGTLIDCLNQFSQPQQLDYDNPWYCHRCKSHVRAIKQMQLYSTPTNLILHLKRFKEHVKNHSLIKFPLLLDLSKQVLNHSLPNDYLGQAAQPPKYQLQAVINHYGELDHGHYTAIARQGEEYYLYNDANVSLISSTEIQSEHAYILLYQKL